MENIQQPIINSLQFLSGIYNLGTGKARTFEDLVKATFAGLDKAPKIEYIDMPNDIRDKYQYFTEAKMVKLPGAIGPYLFLALDESVRDYVVSHLAASQVRSSGSSQ